MLLKNTSRVLSIHFMCENIRHSEAVTCQTPSKGDIPVQGTRLN